MLVRGNSILLVKRWVLVGVIAIFTSARTVAVNLETDDGLSVTFSDFDGSVAAVSLHGASLPLAPGGPGGLSLRIADPIAPHAILHMDFDIGASAVVSARNSSWDGYGSYMTWLPDGGPDNSGHLLLGDGVATGAGMAMNSSVAVTPGANVRIAWQARSATIETTQILCVRIYDASGQDITSTSNVPPGWGYTSVSSAHCLWGFGVSQPDTWELFERFYQVSTDAAFVRVSLRHWTGGDHLLHVDDFALDVVGGVAWSSRLAVLGSISAVTGGFTQSTVVQGRSIRVDSTTIVAGNHLEIGIALQDTSAPMTDRAVELSWTLPVSTTGLRWWDDIDTWRQAAPGTLYRNTFDHNRHPISQYPFSAVTGADFGLSLAVPQDGPPVQRFEYDPVAGLRCVWEIGLSPVTAKIGPGRSVTSLVVLQHDPDWGFRSAADRYFELYPDYFIKRTSHEGSWMYPIHPSQIPDPLDFGFAFLETHPMSSAEHDLCDQLGIDVFYYTEPWCTWQPWGEVPEKPPYEERVARMEEWAASPSSLARWQSSGGLNNSGCLLLSDGVTTGAGMATSNAFAVCGGETAVISWYARTKSTESSQILSVRLYDALGTDITASVPAPPGWFWSSGSEAHVVAGLVNATTNAWEPFSAVYDLPSDATSMRLSVRHWNGGDHLVYIDDLRVGNTNDAVTYLLMPFDVENTLWSSAHNANWDAGDATWLRISRQQAAQAVINASPLDSDARYFIDAHRYFWHEWGGNVGSWNQAWPVNPDPDVTSPSTFELYASESWIYNQLETNAGVYIDSVTTESISSWENHRVEHLAVADSPLTFSWNDGTATQIAPQAHAELLSAVADEVRNRGKLMMLNVFPQAMRFHAHRGDILGSEVSQLVESDSASRVRRTLAKHRIVSNLLQWGWDSTDFITYDQMEQFIRGQLFWGFFPAVSSAGGLVIGGAPDRYFLRPELYERDRPLFQHYIPVIRQLSSAGWQPVTHATATPALQIERFGAFARGPVLLTVRDNAGNAVEAEVTLDLHLCGLTEPSAIEVTDVLADLPIEAARLTDPARARFSVSLAAGEVGVFRLTATPIGTGDYDGDGDVDLADYAALSECLSGPGMSPTPTPPIESQDCLDVFSQDSDPDVDLRDLAVFQTLFSGG